MASPNTTDAYSNTSSNNRRMSTPSNIQVPSPPKTSNGEATVSPRAPQCLCSPTTHNGSFRCKFHRSMGNSWMMRRSKSMPPNKANVMSSPKSVEST